MNMINASQLSFLLSGKSEKISVLDCQRMIDNCFGIEVSEMKKKEYKGIYKEIDIDKFESKYKHYPVRLKIESIQKDYLNTKSTYDYIMNLPLEKIQASKTPIKQISIPKNIKSLLTKEQIDKVYQLWNERYSNYNIDFK